MKAVRVLEYGGPLVFSDVPMPTIARDEILVKVACTAVNHLDLVKALRQGQADTADRSAMDTWP
jgi:NADPH:quinone reductase-like Zn-dependent oxidoreductase